MTSLRSHYVLFSVILIVLILTAVWFSTQHVESNKNTSQTLLKDRHEIQRISTQVRDHVWQIDLAIYSYLLTPTEKLKSDITTTLDKLDAEVDILLEHSWTDSKSKKAIFLKLSGYVHILREEVIRLFDIRENREKRFPSLTIINDILYPTNLEFVTAASLAMGDITSSRINPPKSEALQLLQSLDAIWRRMISSFRILIAYRAETVGDPEYVKPAQISTIDMLQGVIKHNLERLETINKQHHLGFEASDSIEQLSVISDNWFKHYDQVSMIHTSGEWRSDDKIILERLQPISGKIRIQLYELDALLQQSALADINTLTEVAETIINNNWALAGIILLSLFGGFYYLQRRVLLPVSSVVDGLIAQAKNNQYTNLPAPKSREVSELVDAFNHLSLSLNEAEQAREKAEAVARHADKMSTVGELASHVAHEINNPLNNMTRLTEFIQDEIKTCNSSDNVDKDFDVLRSELRRCGDIVKNLMDFGKPGEPVFSSIDLCALARDSWKLLEHKASGDQITVRIDCGKQKHRVHADPAQIQQVFVNLILNAIHFSPEGGVIHITVQKDDDNMLRCRVTDQGVGVEQSDLKHFFDPFFTTKQGHEGMGLGLSVCHSIIKNHSGMIGASRNIPRGVTIWFTLPIINDNDG